MDNNSKSQLNTENKTVEVRNRMRNKIRNKTNSSTIHVKKANMGVRSLSAVLRFVPNLEPVLFNGF